MWESRAGRRQRVGCDVDEILKLGFGGCRLCVQAPEKNNIKDVKSLAGRRVVTSFPKIAKEFFDALGGEGPNTSIKYASGSVEAACSLGIADAVVDLVETGTTMKAAGLEVVAEVMRTESVLIPRKELKHPEIVETIKKRILGYMTATSHVMITYNVAKVNLDKVLTITPGKRAPSSPLLMNDKGGSQEEWMAAGALIKGPKRLADYGPDRGARGHRHTHF